MKIFLKDVATEIVDLFEDVLDKYDIKVPSDEDDQRNTYNTAKLYGTTYFNLIEDVENALNEYTKDIRSEENNHVRGERRLHPYEIDVEMIYRRRVVHWAESPEAAEKEILFLYNQIEPPVSQKTDVYNGAFVHLIAESERGQEV